MPIKTYGIYLAYPPKMTLHQEDLGHYLLSFLRAASLRNDVRFVVVCPAWFKDELRKACENEGVPENCFDLVSPPGNPMVLKFYNSYLARKNKLNKEEKSDGKKGHGHWIEKKIGVARSMPALFAILSYSFLYQCVLFPFYLSKKIINAIQSQIKRGLLSLFNRLDLFNSKGIFFRLYRYMTAHELDLMIKQINTMSHVKAWYCPTALWPSFNRIKVATLMCVPDVVLSDFPVEFSDIPKAERFFETFLIVEKAIHGANYFVTYSEHIKWNTLVKRYGINPENIHVIRHAVDDLAPYLGLTHSPQSDKMENNYCDSLFQLALRKAINHPYSHLFKNTSVKFIFYACQFRPSKNILTLLRAYHYLLHKKYLGHKLILTGLPHILPTIERFIAKHKLTNDIFCLHGLTTPELASCYKLADLVVNPSLNEGGFPFAFTEALSVNTPIVMSKIPITEEVITDSALQEMMLFDPYDWQSVANRIEWALNNRGALLEAQLMTYRELSRRNWKDVVDEHVNILDSISGNSPSPKSKYEVEDDFIPEMLRENS